MDCPETYVWNFEPSVAAIAAIAVIAHSIE
jgi:hypothetical protein